MPNTETEPGPLDLTPVTFNQFVNARTVALLAEYLPEITGLLSIVGHISDPGSARGQWHYGVKLSGDGSQLLTDIPASLVTGRGVAAGQRVRVTGLLRVRANKFGVMEVRVEAGDISLCDGESAPAVEAGGRTTLDKLKSLPVRRFAFPDCGGPLRISLITSSSVQMQVAQDCMTELAKLGNAAQVILIRVNILDPVSVADAVRQADGDVVIVIRGGGNSADFEVFDDHRVVSALAEKDTYRVVGLGHSGNATLLDLVADYSAPTPAQAGLHLREAVEGKRRAQRVVKDRVHGLEKERDAAWELLGKKQKLLEAAEQERDEALQRTGPVLGRQTISYLWVVGALVIGAGIGKIFLR